jgi:D-alanyl-lipoteichoic acid acyltransferase DltB (MBOAT superfamily)
VFATFTLSGIWHGVGWTFVIFGIIQAIIISIELYFKIRTASLSKSFITKLAGIVVTQFIIAMSLVFFRSVNIDQTTQVFSKLFWSTSYHTSDVFSNKFTLIAYSVAIAFVILTMSFEKYSARLVINKNLSLTREVTVTAFMVLVLLAFGVFNSLSFIYFQF